MAVANPANVVDDESPASALGYKPKWYLWNDGNDHTYTHLDEDATVRIVLWGGAALPAWSGREVLSSFYAQAHHNNGPAGSRPQTGVESGGATVYRVAMKTGERLRIQLGGRPTVTGSPFASWANSGDMDDWRLGRIVHGGHGGGGIGSGGHGISPDEAAFVFGPLFADDEGLGFGILRPPDLVKRLPWHSAGGGGATRVLHRPVDGVEQVIIVEPGEGAPSLSLFSYAQGYDGDQPDFATPVRGGGHIARLRDSPPPRGAPDPDYTPPEFPYPPGYTLWYFGWEDISVSEAPNNTVANWASSDAPMSHDTVPAGAAPVSPGGHRWPAPDLSQFDWVAAAHDQAKSLDLRLGIDGGDWDGGDAARTAYGSQLGGGGGFGGGAAGDCLRFTLAQVGDVSAEEGEVPGTTTYPYGRRSGLLFMVVVSQQSASAGGRWWNDRLVEIHFDVDEPKPSTLDHLNTEDFGYYGPTPYIFEPWKFGFGAAWICPEATEAEAGWSVGRLAAGHLAGITQDMAWIVDRATGA